MSWSVLARLGLGLGVTTAGEGERDLGGTGLWLALGAGLGLLGGLDEGEGTRAGLGLGLAGGDGAALHWTLAGQSHAWASSLNIRRDWQVTLLRGLKSCQCRPCQVLVSGCIPLQTL